MSGGPYLAMIRYLLQRPSLVSQFHEAPPRNPSPEAQALDRLLAYLYLTPGADKRGTEELIAALAEAEYGAVYRKVGRLIADIGDTGEDERAFRDAIDQYRHFERTMALHIAAGGEADGSRIEAVVSMAPPSGVESDEFLRSFAWRRVRMFVLRRDGARCSCCGATPATGAVMNVDHIKPRKTHPELALNPGNCQVLCNECNHGKGNWDQTDWRGGAR